MQYDFHICKACGSARATPTYELDTSEVYVCADCGFHYVGYLDPVGEDTSTPPSPTLIEGGTKEYIEQQLQSNRDRFERQLELLRRYVEIPGKKVLDIGCGGGLFLALAKESGADVTGIELDGARARYARTVHGLEVDEFPVEDERWDERSGSFDIVTLWDVIEHVNFPAETLQAAGRLLKPGGLLFLDTPSRDAFYHRAGVMTYTLSGGRFPTFLNSLYSAHPYAHKQILADDDVAVFFERAGLVPIELREVHELSFPYTFYLRKLLGSDRLARLASPLAAVFFRIFRIRNKLIAVGRRSESNDRLNSLQHQP